MVPDNTTQLKEDHIKQIQIKFKLWHKNYVHRILKEKMQFNGLDWSLLVKHLVIKDIHNSWLYCFTNPLELGTRSADDAKAKHVSQVQED